MIFQHSVKYMPVFTMSPRIRLLLRPLGATADFVISTEVSPNQEFQIWYNLVATGNLYYQFLIKVLVKVLIWTSPVGLMR